MRLHIRTSPRGIAAALCIVVSAATGAAIGHNLSTGTPATIAQAVDATQTAVIIIEGADQGYADVKDMVAFLRANGRIVRTINGSESLDSQTGQVLQVMHTLSSAGPIVAYDLIGYHEGGLVARRVLEADPGRIRRIVSIGTAHQGNALAAISALTATGQCSTACEQSQPGSKFIENLPEKVDGHWLSLYTTDDRTIRPADTMVMPGAYNVDMAARCPGLPGHEGLMHDVNTWYLASSFLSSGTVASYCQPAG